MRVGGDDFTDFLGRDDAPPIARRHLCSFGSGGGGPAPAPVYYQPPQTTDPSIIAAQNAAAAAQQSLRGRGATLIVDTPSSGPDLLPSPSRRGGATMLGG